MDAVESRPHKRPKLSPDNVQSDIQDSSHIKSSPGPEHKEQSTTDEKEKVVGIAAYVTDDTVPFEAIYKARYTDFLVNEILPDGRVVHLTSTVVPEELRSKGKSNRKDRRSQDQPQQQLDGEEIKSSAADEGKPGASGGTVAPSDPSATDGIQPQESAQISDDDKQQLIAYLNETAVTAMVSLFQDTFKFPERKSKDHPAVRTGFTSDRGIRTAIHGAIRRIFAGRIESSTDQDGFLVLTAADPVTRRDRKAASNARNNGDGQGSASSRPAKLSWMDRGGEYLHFTLYKENKDTMEAISFLVRQMKTNTKTFQFAGTKDRRAATSQRVSAFRIDAERLASQNRGLRNARVGDFEYQPHGLELGDLTGNEFTITLRDCRFPALQLKDANPETQCSRVRDVLSKQLHNLRQQGFLNYYGLQRFGTFATRTDEVGLLILKSDFKSACEAILHLDADLVVPSYDPRANNNQPNQKSRTGGPNNRGFALPPDDNLRATAIYTYQTTHNLHKALDILPRRFTAENTLLRHLHRNPTDYLGALLAIPRNLRLMYVHAYQSLVWNSAVTHRWKLYGNQVVEGDLVLVSEHPDKENSDNSQNGSSNDNPGQNTDQDHNMDGVDADGEVIVAPAVNDRANTADDLFERARLLTAAEASSGRYTVFDLVLPLPGFDVVYPENPSGGEFYKAFMGTTNGQGDDADDGLDPYDMRRKHRDFSLSGGYRKIMGRIGDAFEVDVKAYSKDEEQFVTTDLDNLKSQQREEEGNPQRVEEKVEVASEQSSTREEKIADPQSEQPEQQRVKIAAILKFKLGASQYATMALRELSRGGVDAFKVDFSGSGFGGRGS